MTKSAKFDESRLTEACQKALAQKKPQIAKIAREFGIPRTTLTDRVKKAQQPPTYRESLRNALEGYQEKALTTWIVKMYDWNLPPPPALIEAWANQALRRTGKDGQVSKMWAYRFIKRLPKDLNLHPVKQKTKESKRIQAEDAGFLAHWYNQLEILLRDIPARLVYNFDECGFRPGEGQSRNVIASKSCVDLAESERGETITAIECIAADGWQMDPFFIFKSGGVFMESWFFGSEDLPQNTLIGTSETGWINDELALVWLDSFHEATINRIKKGEKRYLIFDGHGSHLTFEFLQKCEDHNIIPFGFLPHTTHLCQPLDGKPFLSYKTHFRLMNNELSFWGGQVCGKSEFLRVIGPVRFNQRIIRESFKDRGIWPVNGSKIVENLINQLVIPDLIAPDLQSWGARTPSPSPNLLTSSSVENTPPKSIEAIKKNQSKILKHIGGTTPKLQRDLAKIFTHQQIAAENLRMANDTIVRIRAVQEPLQRQITKRQVKPLSQTGVLKPCDANRSIKVRKEKETATKEKRLAKQWKKIYGEDPPRRPTQSNPASIEAARVSQENREVFFFDSGPIG